MITVRCAALIRLQVDRSGCNAPLCGSVVR